MSASTRAVAADWVAQATAEYERLKRLGEWLNGRQEGEDVAQGTIVRAHECAANHADPPPAGWLFGTARNVARKLRRNKQREVELADGAPVNWAGPEACLADVQDWLETLFQFVGVLQRLEKDDRLALLAKHLGSQQVAKSLEIDVSTLYTRGTCVRRDLRATDPPIAPVSGLMEFCQTARDVMDKLWRDIGAVAAAFYAFYPCPLVGQHVETQGLAYDIEVIRWPERRPQTRRQGKFVCLDCEAHKLGAGFLNQGILYSSSGCQRGRAPEVYVPTTGNRLLLFVAGTHTLGFPVSAYFMLRNDSKSEAVLNRVHTELTRVRAELHRAGIVVPRSAA